VDLVLRGPKGAFALGRIAGIGAQRALGTDDNDVDRLKLRFVTLEDLARGDLSALLREHLDVVQTSRAIG
jgi:hypothetical protein